MWYCPFKIVCKFVLHFILSVMTQSQIRSTMISLFKLPVFFALNAQNKLFLNMAKLKLFRFATAAPLSTVSLYLIDIEWPVTSGVMAPLNPLPLCSKVDIQHTGPFSWVINSKPFSENSKVDTH